VGQNRHRAPSTTHNNPPIRDRVASVILLRSGNLSGERLVCTIAGVTICFKSHKFRTVDAQTLPFSSFIMAALCNRGALMQIGCLPYFYTWCGPSANLECMSEMCCMRLAANAGPKIVAKNRHLGTIGQLCRAIPSQLRHVSTIGKKTC